MNFFPHNQNPNPNYPVADDNYSPPPAPPPSSYPQFAAVGGAPEFDFSDYLFPEEARDHDDDRSNYMGDYSPDPHSFPAATTTTTTDSPVPIGSGGGDGGSWNSVGNDDGDQHESRRNNNGKLKTSSGSEVAHKRVAFRTKSELEVMDDGFKWRKYGKKSVKNTPNPRHYYKCSSMGCNVKKRVERDREDSRYVITTYEGVHAHESPSSIQRHGFYSTTTQTKPYPSSSSSPSST